MHENAASSAGISAMQIQDVRIDVPAERAENAKAVVVDEDDEGDAKSGFFESDFFLSIVTTVNVAVAVYSAVMASLLALFVPQLCCPDVS